MREISTDDPRKTNVAVSWHIINYLDKTAYLVFKNGPELEGNLVLKELCPEMVLWDHVLGQCPQVRPHP